MNRTAFAFLFALTTSWSGAQSVQALTPAAIALENYGQALAASTPDRAIVFKKVEKTDSSSYKVSFQTSAPELLAAADARTNSSSKLANLGRTKLWEAKFCTDELNAILVKLNVNIAVGSLEDAKGELQSGAFCIKQVLGAQPPTPGEIIGAWSDDVGSPSYLNATFTISSQNGKTYLNRTNGDGSKGAIRIYDKQGFVRLAKAKLNNKP
jgi:hypothetical protein